MSKLYISISVFCWEVSSLSFFAAFSGGEISVCSWQRCPQRCPQNCVQLYLWPKGHFDALLHHGAVSSEAHEPLVSRAGGGTATGDPCPVSPALPGRCCRGASLTFARRCNGSCCQKCLTCLGAFCGHRVITFNLPACAPSSSQKAGKMPTLLKRS